MNPTDLQRAITEHPFWAGINERFLPLLYQCGGRERFAANREIFREGRKANRFYLIHQGRVALEVFVPGRGVKTIQTLDAGDALGWSWLFPPYRWHFTARSLEEDTEAITFDATPLRSGAKKDHELGYELASRVAKIMSERLQATRMQLLDFYGLQS